MLNTKRFISLNLALVLNAGFALKQTALAADPDFSGGTDYSSGVYRRQSNYNLDHSMNYTPSWRNQNDATNRTFSSNVLIRQNHPEVGYRPQPVTSTNNYNLHYTSTSNNPAYYKTNPYKY